MALANRDRIKVVSFDLEGTLVTPDFSQGVWAEAIPRRYALTREMDVASAKAAVFSAYEEVGDQRLEWYDIRYWFRRFGLGDHRQVLEGCRHLASAYPEVSGVLSRLSQRFQIIITSNSSRDFLGYLLAPLPAAFPRVFSSVSDFGQLKTASFYRRVCQALEVEPDEMIHVGDSWQFDFVAAQEAGIFALHLDREGNSASSGSLSSLSDLESILS